MKIPMRALALAMMICLVSGSPKVALARAGRVDPLYQPTGAQQERAIARARSFVARENYAAAIKSFDQVIALQPQFAKAIAERGFAREAIGDFTGAMADHDAVLRLTPDRPNAWSHACWIRALQGLDLDQALIYCDKAVQLKASIDPLDSRGFVRFRRGEFDLALTDYNAALRLFPRSASTLFMRGIVKRRMGDVAAGDTDIARALKIDQKISEVWKRRGIEA